MGSLRGLKRPGRHTDVDRQAIARELVAVARELTALSVPERHQRAIALKTLKMNDAMANVMGGMNKDEARAFLKKIGYSDSKIRRLEASRKGPPKMQKQWRDIPIGSKFKVSGKRQKWLKIGKYAAVPADAVVKMGKAEAGEHDYERIASSMGSFSGDATGVFGAIVMMNKNKSDSAILRIVKNDDFLAEEIEEMSISDRELRSYIRDERKFLL